MNVHLIRTPEVPQSFFQSVWEILTGISGPIQYHLDPYDMRMYEDELTELPFDEDKFNKKLEFPKFSSVNSYSEKKAVDLSNWPPPFPEKITRTTWDRLFHKCDRFRMFHNIPDEDHVLIITRISNDLNWFAGTDKNNLNHFVHADQWEFFLPCDPRFPVAYEVTATVMRRLMFNGYRDGESYAHEFPKGCMNDFCKNKKEVTLKLRTGDICTDCMKVIVQNNIYQPYVDQVLRTFDAIRTQMLFRERYRNNQRASRVLIKGVSRKIIFTDLADAELKLTPLERVLFLLFLKEEQGLLLNELCDHRDWIRDTYKIVGNPKTIVEMGKSIQQLVDPTENSASEKISKIRKKLEDLLGEDIAKQYIIEGPNRGKKKIALDRSLVTYSL